jgi:hypothetical protein
VSRSVPASCLNSACTVGFVLVLASQRWWLEKGEGEGEGSGGRCLAKKLLRMAADSPTTMIRVSHGNHEESRCLSRAQAVGIVAQSIGDRDATID